MNMGSMIEGKTVKKSRFVLGAFSSGKTSVPAPLVTMAFQRGIGERRNRRLPDIGPKRALANLKAART
jgi:hypothetical protein